MMMSVGLLTPHAAKAGAQEACPDGTKASILRLNGRHFVFWVTGKNKENPGAVAPRIWPVNGKSMHPTATGTSSILRIVILIKNQFSIMIDWSVVKNQFFDPLINFRSYMINLFIFLWAIFRFFLFFVAGFHHTCTNKSQDLNLRNPNLEIYPYVCGPMEPLTSRDLSIKDRSSVNKYIDLFFGGFFTQFNSRFSI